MREKIYRKKFKVFRLAIFFLYMVLGLGGLSCGSSMGSDCLLVTSSASIVADVTGTGTITYFNFEGGFCGIVADDSQGYLPVNLCPQFEINGLRVRFEAKILEDISTIVMWGTPVELIAIEKL